MDTSKAFANKPPEDIDFHQFDKFRLDEEWESQPRYYRHYAEKVAEAEYNQAYLKTQLELAEAEVELAVRKNPEGSGIEKVTESVVKALVIMDQKVRQVKQKLIMAEHDVDVAKVAVRTLDHRKASLEGATQLFLAGYFARPHVKGGQADRAMSAGAAERAFSKNRKGD